MSLEEKDMVGAHILSDMSLKCVCLELDTYGNLHKFKLYCHTPRKHTPYIKLHIKNNTLIPKLYT